MVTFDELYNGRPILANKELGYGCEIDILARIDALLSFMMQKHSKVLFIRFDVRFPRYVNFQNDNLLFSEFMANFIKYLTRKDLDPEYVWVREQDSSNNQHYHCILLLNGHKVQNYYPVLQKADALWSNLLGVPCQGLVHFCDTRPDGSRQKNGLMIRRDKHAQEGLEDQCFQWGSYLAKTATKDANLYNTRSVGNSRIPQELYRQSIQTHLLG